MGSRFVGRRAHHQAQATYRGWGTADARVCVVGVASNLGGGAQYEACHERLLTAHATDAQSLRGHAMPPHHMASYVAWWCGVGQSSSCLPCRGTRASHCLRMCACALHPACSLDAVNERRQGLISRLKISEKEREGLEGKATEAQQFLDKQAEMVKSKVQANHVFIAKLKVRRPAATHAQALLGPGWGLLQGAQRRTGLHVCVRMPAGALRVCASPPCAGGAIGSAALTWWHTAPGLAPAGQHHSGRGPEPRAAGKAGARKEQGACVDGQGGSGTREAAYAAVAQWPVTACRHVRARQAAIGNTAIGNAAVAAHTILGAVLACVQSKNHDSDLAAADGRFKAADAQHSQVLKAIDEADEAFKDVCRYTVERADELLTYACRPCLEPPAGAASLLCGACPFVLGARRPMKCNQSSAMF